MGVYFLRNFLFLRVNLLEPKAMVFGSAWTTTPLLSQRFGLLPSWFYSMTWSPISRGGSSLVPCCSLSCILADLGANASSLQSATSCHVSLNSLWRVRCALGLVPGLHKVRYPGNGVTSQSKIWQPNPSWAKGPASQK
jgi:hypothetical protein